MLAINRVAFDILDFDKDGILSVLDLMRIEENFEAGCELAKEMSKVLTIYKNKNIRTKNVRVPLVIDFENFCLLVP